MQKGTSKKLNGFNIDNNFITYFTLLKGTKDTPHPQIKMCRFAVSGIQSYLMSICLSYIPFNKTTAYKLQHERRHFGHILLFRRKTKEKEKRYAQSFRCHENSSKKTNKIKGKCSNKPHPQTELTVSPE